MAHSPITRYGEPRSRTRLNSIAFGMYSDDDNQSEPTGSLERTKSGSMPFACWHIAQQCRVFRFHRPSGKVAAIRQRRYGRIWVLAFLELKAVRRPAIYV
jgi:hypothetical protein